MSEADDSETLEEALLDVLSRVNDGDLSARMPQNFTRESDRRIASLLDSVAEAFGKVTSDRRDSHGRLEADVWELSELFLRLAQGDFTVRSNRGDSGGPMDVLSYLFDNTVIDVAALFSELRSQRIVVDSMLNSLLDSVFLLSPAGDIQKLNESASTLLGWPSEELIGTSFHDVLAPRDRSFFRDLQHRAEVRNRDTLFRTRTGELIPLVFNGAAVNGEDGNLLGIVLAGRDERELRKARTQLQLSDRLATMGSLAAGVAHEINNPLSFVVSNLEFVIEELTAVPEMSPVPTEIRGEMLNALQTACKGTARVAGIVRDLKSISRVESDARSPVNINGLLDSATAMLSHEIRHRAKLSKEYGEELYIHVNEARAMQVFLNLIQNAVQALPIGKASGNEIVLRTRIHDAASVLIEVADSGCGIPQEDLATIFDEFFTTKEVGVGTGLGLSICKRLVEQMNGRIEVTSAVDRGTTFRVYLPVAPGKVSRHSKEAIEKPLPPAARHRVLVVDDELEVGEAIRRLLRKQYDVDLTSCGDDALALFRQRRHDFILCDIMMPEMSGPAFLKALEEQFPKSTAQVIFMTGGEFSSNDFVGLPQSPLSLEKPFSPTALRAILNSARVC